MDAHYFYEQIKFWLPLASAFGLLIRAYFSIKKQVAGWAESLLETHLGKINSTLELIKSNDIHHVYQEIQEIPLSLDRHTQTICNSQDRNSERIIDELQQLRADFRSKK